MNPKQPGNTRKSLPKERDDNPPPAQQPAKPVEPQFGGDTLAEKQQRAQQFQQQQASRSENADVKHIHDTSNQDVRAIRNRNIGSDPKKDNNDHLKGDRK